MSEMPRWWTPEVFACHARGHRVITDDPSELCQDCRCQIDPWTGEPVAGPLRMPSEAEPMEEYVGEDVR